MLGLIAGVIIVGAALAFVLWERRPPPYTEARRRELKQTVVASGRVLPPAEIRLDSLLTSTVKSIAKREGDTVRAGERLLVLDESDIAAARAQAEAAVAQARAGRTSVRLTTLPRAIETLDQIRTSLEEARADVERQRTLFAAGVVPGTVLERSERTLRIQESQEKAALTEIRAASAGGSQSLTAAAALALAEAQLASVIATEQRACVVAPTDGVIAERFVEVGESIRPGTPLFRLTATGRTRIAIEPDERNLGLIREGMAAVASAEAYPGETFDAVVSFIAPEVNADRGTIEVRLDVPRPPDHLRPNMTVSVELLVESRFDVIAVSLASVRSAGPNTGWVGVLDKRGTIERREVRLGLRGDDAVEVVAGLAEGERVVLDPPAGSAAVSP